jgi:O-acetyl-ADP-ribose deacetylase
VELAAAQGAASIAFPCISTGVYGYPADAAAGIAVATVREALAATVPSALEEVVFCCFSPDDLALYESLLADG